MGMVQKPSAEVITKKLVFCRNPVGNGSAPVLRREILEKIKFPHATRSYPCWFDESFRQSEDIECWSRLALIGGAQFACVPQPLTFYRINATGLSADTEQQFMTWQRVRNKLAAIDPQFIARHGELAKAYQLRYLARRSIMSGDSMTGLKLMTRAMVTAPSILIEEPRRTLATMAGTLAAVIIPARTIKWIMTNIVSRRPSKLQGYAVEPA